MLALEDVTNADVHVAQVTVKFTTELYKIFFSSATTQAIPTPCNRMESFDLS